MLLILIFATQIKIIALKYLIWDRELHYFIADTERRRNSATASVRLTWRHQAPPTMPRIIVARYWSVAERKESLVGCSATAQCSVHIEFRLSRLCTQLAVNYRRYELSTSTVYATTNEQDIGRHCHGSLKAGFSYLLQTKSNKFVWLHNRISLVGACTCQSTTAKTLVYCQSNGKSYN